MIDRHRDSPQVTCFRSVCAHVVSVCAALPLCSFLDLSSNNLIGTVPSTLSALTVTNPDAFVFKANGLHGAVPSGLTSRFPANAPSWTGTCITGATNRPATCDFPGRDALMDLYVATAGWSWTVRVRNGVVWGNTSVSPCSWHGLTCNSGNTAVVSMDLSANNLVGSLPDSIGDLIGLTYVGLQWQRVSALVC